MQSSRQGELSRRIHERLHRSLSRILVVILVGVLSAKLANLPLYAGYVVDKPAGGRSSDIETRCPHCFRGTQRWQHCSLKFRMGAINRAQHRGVKIVKCRVQSRGQFRVLVPTICKELAGFLDVLNNIDRAALVDLRAPRRRRGSNGILTGQARISMSVGSLAFPEL